MLVGWFVGFDRLTNETNQSNERKRVAILSGKCYDDSADFIKFLLLDRIPLPCRKPIALDR